MLKKLYVKNYKTFNEDLFEFSKINLLLGENSSGKSSLLRLIHVISNVQKCTFDETEWQNETFKSLTNLKSESNKEIVISFDSQRNEQQKYVQMRISSVDRKPYIKFYKVYLKDFDIILSCKHVKDRTYYRMERNVKNINFENFNDDSILNYKFFKENSVETVRIESRDILPYRLLELIEKKYKIPQYDIFIYLFMQEMKFIEPIRKIPTKIEFANKDTKNVFDGSDFLVKLTKSKIEENKILKIISEFGKSTKMFDELVLLPLTKRKLPILPVLLTIKDGENYIPLKDVGTGISQVLPVLIDLITVQDLSICQPELHLHPSAQYELGKEIFIRVNKGYDKQVFIESHSDFIIDAIREGIFLSDLVYKEITRNETTVHDYIKKYLSPENDEGQITINSKPLVAKIKKALIEQHDFIKSVDYDKDSYFQNVINYAILNFANDIDIRESLRIYFLKLNNNTVVYPITVQKNGKFDKSNMKIYRDFYIKNSVKGLLY